MFQYSSMIMRELFVLLATISITSAIMCYVCNTDYNSDCWNDYTPFLKGCPKKLIGRERIDAVGCRTINLYIGEEHSLVRECAYLGEDVVGKKARGSFQLVQEYTQCSDKHGCNSVSFLTGTISIASILSLIALRA